MNKRIAPLLLVTFIGSFGLSVVIPILVYLVNDFGGNPFIYGLMGATYPLFQLVGAPILGNWSDRFGRKKILFLSQAGTLLSWGIFLLAFFLPNDILFNHQSEVLGEFSFSLPLACLFFARALDGLTGGNVSVAYAYMGDMSDDSNRKANFGYMSAASNIGFIAGPALSSVLLALLPGYEAIVWLALIISLVGVIIIFLWLDEHVPEKDTDRSEASLRRIIKIPNVKYMLVMYFLIFLGFNFFYTTFPNHASDQLQGLAWEPAQLGIYMSVLSMAMAVVQLSSGFFKRFKDYQMVTVGSLILSSYFFVILSPSEAVIYIAILFFALGNGVMWPAYLSVLSSCGSKGQQGSIQGLGSSFGSAASIIGLMTGGFLYGIIGKYTFLVAGSIILLVFLLSFKMKSISNG